MNEKALSLCHEQVATRIQTSEHELREKEVMQGKLRVALREVLS
jgi:hypothetical protein